MIITVFYIYFVSLYLVIASQVIYQYCPSSFKLTYTRICANIAFNVIYGIILPKLSILLHDDMRNWWLWLCIFVIFYRLIWSSLHKPPSNAEDYVRIIEIVGIWEKNVENVEYLVSKREGFLKEMQNVNNKVSWAGDWNIIIILK